MTLKVLEWDSSFFNKKIGALSNVNTNTEQIEIEEDFDLLYVFSQEKIRLKNYAPSYQETKVTYEKLLKKKSKDFNSKEIKSVNELQHDVEALKQIAYESGKYSRFKLDPNFKLNDFYKLYDQWIINSLNQRIATDILVFLEKNKIVGLLTYKVYQEKCQIGLIGVASGLQGKNIGSQLMETLESILINREIYKIEVATQKKNEPANRFYRKLEYSLKNSQNIYHYWKI